MYAVQNNIGISLSDIFNEFSLLSGGIVPDGIHGNRDQQRPNGFARVVIIALMYVLCATCGSCKSTDAALSIIDGHTYPDRNNDEVVGDVNLRNEVQSFVDSLRVHWVCDVGLSTLPSDVPLGR